MSLLISSANDWSVHDNEQHSLPITNDTSNATTGIEQLLEEANQYNNTTNETDILLDNETINHDSTSSSLRTSALWRAQDATQMDVEVIKASFIPHVKSTIESFKSLMQQIAEYTSVETVGAECNVEQETKPEENTQQIADCNETSCNGSDNNELNLVLRIAKPEASSSSSSTSADNTQETQSENTHEEAKEEVIEQHEISEANDKSEDIATNSEDIKTVEQHDNNDPELEANKSKALVFKANLKEMLQQLPILINNSLESGDEELLSQLIALNEQLQTILERSSELGITVDPELEENAEEMSEEDKKLYSDFYQAFDGDNGKGAGKDDVTPTYCPICDEDVPKNETYTYFDCKHTYCKECLEMYYETKINTGSVMDISCPDPTCNVAVQVIDIAAVVSQDMFNKYQEFSLLAFLKADTTTRWCPNAKCGAAITGRPRRGQVRQVCNDCATVYCYDCKVEWHEGQTCAEYSAVPDDPKTAKWKKKHGVKKCPHCGVATIKRSGCPDMKCVNCNKHWDWHYDEAPKEKESLVEKAGFFLPRYLKEMLGSRELHEGLKENKKKTLKEFGIPIACFTAVGIPLVLVAGPPALTYKGSKKIKRSWNKQKKKKQSKAAAATAVAIASSTTTTSNDDSDDNQVHIANGKEEIEE